MSKRNDTTKRFRVALSYSGNERSYVENVANHLIEHFDKAEIFYDRYFQAELARPNLDTYLQNIYLNDANLVVLFFSDSYNRKMWCGLEWRAIRNLIAQYPNTIIPVNMTSSSLPEGLFSTDGYLAADKLNPVEVANNIIERYIHEFEKSSNASNIPVNYSKPNNSRRNFMLSIMSATGIGSLYFVFKDFLYPTSSLKFPEPTGLIVNPKSKIIHHKVACKSHLPKTQVNSSFTLKETVEMLHKEKLVHIAELTARKNYGREAEYLLIEAIKYSPTSTHLYKFLIGIWGKNKQYNKIHEFLSISINYLEKKVTQHQKNPRLSKKYQKAITDLLHRKNRAEYLAEMAKLTKT